MKKLILVVVTMLFSFNVFAAENTTTQPTEASIKELLKVMDVQALLESMRGQLQNAMKNSVQQALQGKQPTPAQQQSIDKMSEKLVALFKENMNWEYMESMYIRVYQQSFSQAEVNSMLKFYRSPEGQAVVKKMPLVTQSTMSEVQKQMGTIMPQMQQVMREGMQEIQAAGNEGHAEPAPATGSPATQPAH